MSFFKTGSVVTQYDSNDNDVPDGEYLTLEEYCDSNNLSHARVYQWVHRGLIKAYKLSNRVVIPVGEVPKKVRLSNQ